MLSVIVPTYNREECLYSALESLNQQDFADFEVIVVDQSENVAPGKIARILRSCKNVRYYNIDKKGRSLSKNFAISQSRGDVLLFCDDDIIAEENFLSVHYSLHREHPEVGALSCHLIEPHETEIDYKVPLKITLYGRFVNKANAVYEGYVTSLNGGNMSFKKRALEQVGFFEERLAGTSMLEEPDIAYRLLQSGYRLYFSAQTKVKHYPQHNGNIKIMQKHRYAWLRHYFFNQYYFLYRNRRVRLFPLVLTYLSYRTLMEMKKYKQFSPRFALLPVDGAVRAFRFWQEQKRMYTASHWFTPSLEQPAIIHYDCN